MDQERQCVFTSLSHVILSRECMIIIANAADFYRSLPGVESRACRLPGNMGQLYCTQKVILVLLMLSEYNAAVAQYGCPRSLPQPPDIPPLIEAYYGYPAATVEIAEFMPVCTSRSNETATVAVRYACTESTPCKDDIVADGSQVSDW